MSAFNQLFLLDRALEKWIIPETTKTVQDLRDPIVGKDGDFVNIVKLTVPFSLKSRPYVCA